MGLFDYDQPAAEHAELQEITLLADLSEEDWSRVLNIVETRQFKSGEDLIRAGDEDDSFYILTGGQVDVVIVLKTFSRSHSVRPVFITADRRPRSLSTVPADTTFSLSSLNLVM